MRRPQTGRAHPDPDPFAGEWDTIDAWLAAQPERPVPTLPSGQPPCDPAYLSDESRLLSAPCAGDERRTENNRPYRPRPIGRADVTNGCPMTCAACGAPDTVNRGARGPVTAYCAPCREERKRDQARQRMVMMRTRRRSGAEPCG